MSSTKRGSDRHNDDFYRTPRWAVEALLDRLGDLQGVILEPGCGDGAILSVLRDRGCKWLIGVEQDVERARLASLEIVNGAVVCGDFLSPDLPGFLARAAPAWGPPDFAVSNPPFALAQPFIERTLEVLQPRGQAWFLLRLAFLAGQKRAKSGLWRKLSGVYVLPKRPSFIGGTTDSSDYAWIEWTNEVGPLPTLEHLEVR